MSQHQAIRPDAVRLQLINIDLTRETAEWILDDLAKRGKRLRMCVDNPNTRAAYAVTLAASALEFKDIQWGGKWDWTDWPMTVLGGAAGYGLHLLVCSLTH